MNKANLILGVFIGVVLALILSLVTASKVISTGKAEFCSSCHEMKVFYETWAEGVHGPAKMGVVKAQCADCHLPHDNLLSYLVSKFKFGLNDYLGHLRGKGTPKYWLVHWEHKKPYQHQAYESGCRECHQELVAPGIPLKAFTAHRQYELGLTRETCISCHQSVGHGDVITAMRAALKQDQEKSKKH